MRSIKDTFLVLLFLLASPLSGKSSDVVPGSKLSSRRQAAELRKWLRCFAGKGSWVYDPNPRPLPWSRKGPDNCEQDKGTISGAIADSVKEPKGWTVREGLKYRWKTKASCGKFVPFRRKLFCSAMAKLGGPILLAGDSMTKTMFESLQNNLEMGTSPTVAMGLGKGTFFTPRLCVHWLKTGKVPTEKRSCGALDVCRHIIYWVRNDRLTRTEFVPQWRTIHYYLPWLTLIKTWGIKAVVLNRGAHFTPTKTFVKELNAALRVLRQRYPKLLVLYRSSTVGHPGCKNATLPLDVMQDLTQLPFHWGVFHEQNLEARRLVEKYGGVYLDVEHLTGLRPDGHLGYANSTGDCLHYCNPGPVDTWSQLLLNALLGLL